MSEFTYDPPDEKKYFSAILRMLSQGSQNEKQMADLLKGGCCTIAPSNQYSQKRWDALSTTVYFYVPVDSLDFFNKDEKDILVKLCDKIMPKRVGYDVQGVEISPSLEDISIEPTLTSDLENIQNSISIQTIQILPDDIKRRGKEMADVYIYLYCIENSLRLFIERVFVNYIGDDYWLKISIPNSVKTSIQTRRDAERKNQWISVRGNSKLFYLDFKELAVLITNNWNYFKNYFPDQQWLNVKIEELGSCRNLIAHNSYVGSMERDVIRLNYNQILKQIESVETEKNDLLEENDELPF
jgi:hypothetical protein